MARCPRSFPILGDRPSTRRSRRPARRWSLVLGSTAATLLAALFAAAPAGAVVSGTYGVQERTRKAPAIENAPLQYHHGKVLHLTDAYVIYWDPTGSSYRGDWERLIDKYFQDVAAESGTLNDNFAVTTQYRDGEGDAANQWAFRGSYKVTDPYPTTEIEGKCEEPPSSVCINNVAIEKELVKVKQSVAPPLPGESGTPVYYILTPPNVTVCTGSGAGSIETCSNSSQLETENAGSEAKTGICGYHSYLSGEIPYVVQPWVAGETGLSTSVVAPSAVACQGGSPPLEEPNQLTELNPFGNYAEGLADVIITDLSIEQSDVVADPFLNGWYQTGSHAEQSDVCRYSFGPPPSSAPTADPNTHAANLSDETINGDRFYVPWAFNSIHTLNGKGVFCTPGVSQEPYFSAPSPVNTGDYVGFNATESLITLDANPEHISPEEPFVPAEYEWNFGDGTITKGTNAKSEFHSYEYAGTYTVSLTVTDSAGNKNTTTREITVVGKERSGPSGPGGPGGAPASGGSSSSSSSSAGASGAGGAKRPVASAAASSQTLRNVLSKGLLVRYTVSEQVAGRVEVLLAASLARRVGLNGPAAAGLPVGTPAQLEIGKGIVDTTRGGHGTVKIKFGKVTAQRLRRLGKVTLLLRLIVRNSAGQTATVLTNVALHP